MTNVFDGKLNIIFLNISFPLLEFKVPFRLSLKILKQLSSITLIYSSLGIGCYSRATARCSNAIIPISRHICFFPLPPKVLLAPFEQEIFFSLANRPMIFLLSTSFSAYEHASVWIEPPLSPPPYSSSLLSEFPPSSSLCLETITQHKRTE